MKGESISSSLLYGLTCLNPCPSRRTPERAHHRPFTARTPVKQPVLVTGIPAIDSILGGVPCGEITEIVGTRWCSAGRKNLQSQLLARATRDQFCALVDATDSFDPKSAREVGVDLRRLLWIRCGGQGMKAMEQAFKSADLLLQGSGGVGLVGRGVWGGCEAIFCRCALIPT